MKKPASKYQNPDLSAAIPELAPEVIASRVTPDPSIQTRLCARLRRHWRDNPSFRNSFKRKDPRDVCFMWMEHWCKAIEVKTRAAN